MQVVAAWPFPLTGKCPLGTKVRIWPVRLPFTNPLVALPHLAQPNWRAQKRRKAGVLLAALISRAPL